MRWLTEVIGGVLPLVVLGTIIWVIVRTARRHRGTDPEEVDQAATIRRLFVYGLLFTTLMMSASGAVLVLQELLDSNSDRVRDRSALAFGLALVIVAAPTYSALLHHVRGRLRHDATRHEGRSFAWAGYLNLSLIVSLIATVVTTHEMFETLFGVSDFEVETVAPVAVWGVVWATHWFWLKAQFGLPGDVHLAAGSLTGLITLSVGLWGLVFAGGEAVYSSLVKEVPRGHPEPGLVGPVIATLIGAAAWTFHWLSQYQRSERTNVWHVYVVLVGGLGGLVTAIGAAATSGYCLLVWFVGDPSSSLPSRHFEDLTGAGATLLVGVVVWQYHRYAIQQQ
ncbi:MAG: DUF5671 domain-containing protein, partial [Actinomycetota bacterium]|nr:DUF5671 domain-containing protein [Actinomycetota bacterium]